MAENPNPAATPAATNTPAPAPAPAAAKPAPAAAPKPAAPPAPPEPPRPSPVPEIPLPFVGLDFLARGVHGEAVVEPANIVKAAQEMDKAGFSIDTITGLDWMAQGQMEVVYDFFHAKRNLRLAIRAKIPRENANIDTISKVFPGANWHERETHDFFGIVFNGHPDLSPFLLPEDATYHPLRKDFKQ